ncbi:hypothetical protein GMAR_ORF277 [Golden Marseillevirus]|uniref:hypothetical protein n=1 Tax=Golden Marseillevirus TaxID=1720526 RepID=UPI000877AD72|nr:hypothetical protein GMAR_ORF277 [Golden Marseillevirus]ALX27651.1 hypothetical protein GMAR_ORF277 [Golden Marseillevirus]
MQKPRYGEIPCQREGCKNKAYWEMSGSFVCGVHSRNKERTALAKMSVAAKRFEEHQKFRKHNGTIEKAACQNSGRGELGLYRMAMMKPVPLQEGWLNVFPNFRHQERKDGYGCKNLSPMSLGPVEHSCPGLPPAQNIENFFQGSKVFSEEVDSLGNPTELYYQNREKFFKDKVPQRHKYKGKDKNKNIPLYFLWTDSTGKEHRLGYVESRQTYCNFFERLAVQTPEWLELCRLNDEGYNLMFCGYDAHEICGDIDQAYLDPSVPFGHERVLFAMLSLRDTPEEYPWRKYKTLDF